MTKNFACSVMASNADEAVARVAKQCAKVPGFAVTGAVEVKSERHGIWNVQVAMEPGSNKNDFWVVATSFGVSPSKALGSRWQSVAGVGC